MPLSPRLPGSPTIFSHFHSHSHSHSDGVWVSVDGHVIVYGFAQRLAAAILVVDVSTVRVICEPEAKVIFFVIGVSVAEVVSDNAVESPCELAGRTG